MLDRQREQRAQPLGDLLTRHALGQPVGRDLETMAAVDERVAGDDCMAVPEPEHDVVRHHSGERLDADG